MDYVVDYMRFDYDRLSNWDCCETDSLEDAEDIIDGGYGILPLVA